MQIRAILEKVAAELLKEGKKRCPKS